MSFLTDVFSCSKYCPALLETVDLRESNRNFRDFGLLNVDFKRRNCLLAQCASASNAVGSDTDIFN